MRDQEYLYPICDGGKNTEHLRICGLGKNNFPFGFAYQENGDHILISQGYFGDQRHWSV